MPKRRKVPESTPDPAGDGRNCSFSEEAYNNGDDVECDNYKSGMKRAPPDDDDYPADFTSEMKKMLECFGTDISKTLTAKRRRLEQYTDSSTKNTNKKVEEIWNKQQSERNKLSDEYNKQMKGVFQQWESDVSKAKEQEETLLRLFQQQQKFFQQTRVVLSQRLKTVQQLHDRFVKGMVDLEQCHHKQQNNVHSELRKEMALLQKRILMDTQQQEMANVRKSLQTMFF